MSIIAQISGKFDDNTYKVDIQANSKSPVKSFKVPEKEIDSFIKNYDKNEKKCSIISNTAFGSAIVAGVLLTALCTKNLGSKFLKWGLNTLGGVAASFLAIAGCAKYIDNAQNKLVQQHSAEEIAN